jgi:chaperonin GroEL
MSSAWEDTQGRIPQIRARIDETTCDYGREKPRERLAKLTGGVMVIQVGGTLEVEVRERQDWGEDAMHATRVAAEAIIAAGGTAPLYAAIIVVSLGTWLCRGTTSCILEASTDRP